MVGEISKITGLHNHGAVDADFNGGIPVKAEALKLIGGENSVVYSYKGGISGVVVREFVIYRGREIAAVENDPARRSNTAVMIHPGISGHRAARDYLDGSAWLIKDRSSVVPGFRGAYYVEIIIVYCESMLRIAKNRVDGIGKSDLDGLGAFAACVIINGN